MCIWLTPGAAVVAGWPPRRLFGTRQRRCHMFSSSAGPVGFSPRSASPSQLSAHTHTHTIPTIHLPFPANNELKIVLRALLCTNLLISHWRLYMQSSFLFRQRRAARRFLLRRLTSYTNSSCSRVKTCCFRSCWNSFLLRSTTQSTGNGSWTWEDRNRQCWFRESWRLSHIYQDAKY